MDISGISGVTSDSAPVAVATEALSSTTAELDAAMTSLITGLADHIGQSLDIVA